MALDGLTAISLLATPLLVLIGWVPAWWLGAGACLAFVVKVVQLRLIRVSLSEL